MVSDPFPPTIPRSSTCISQSERNSIASSTSGSTVWILPSPQIHTLKHLPELNNEPDLSRLIGNTHGRTPSMDCQLVMQYLPDGTSRVGDEMEDDVESKGESSNSDQYILPDAEPEGEVILPSAETFGPDFFERRRQLWLNGQLPSPSATSLTNPPLDPSDPLTAPASYPLHDPRPSPNPTSSSFSKYISQPFKGRTGRLALPSFLSSTPPRPPPIPSVFASPEMASYAAFPSSPATVTPTSPIQHNAAAGPSSSPRPMSYGEYQAARANPPPSGLAPAPSNGQEKDAGAIERLEALLAAPGAEETEETWKALEPVWKFLVEGKPLRRGIRLGLVIKILRAGWIHDGTWPASMTTNGAANHQLAALQNDPFFASPPRPIVALPETTEELAEDSVVMADPGSGSTTSSGMKQEGMMEQ